MSWAPDSPVELPDGRLICGSHGLVGCGRCCVDYSFMYDILDEDPSEWPVRRPEENEDDLDRAGSLDIDRLDPIRRMEMFIGRDQSYQLSFNRAELRAIIGALRYRNWASEGFTTLVLATDSEYVVKGATEWIQAWLRRGWRKSGGGVVSNVDMWQVFLGEVERWDEYGVKIQLWRIPREWNTEADRLAKEGAQLNEELTFKERLGIP
ncbi:ribonuclease H [Fusarium napiforme]|uniref:ribonuclease H n=1 Tax=Fusarium napiforme TaxID=42672 RepID=A0A8H5MN06_9HYPO|nr:ribonuclease H [Fusarium napiforme]